MSGVALGGLAACLAGALALVVQRFEADRMPQFATGADVLSVAFGDARTVLSSAMVQKADSYFHGGIDMECDDEDCRGHDHGRGHDGGHDGSDDCTCAGCAGKIFDPWAWINVRIRAPRAPKHLAGDEAVELMPWLWASVKADPRNVQAWLSARHVAERVLRKPELARRILEEARRANPGSAVLVCEEGRMLYAQGRGDLGAAEALFERACRMVEETGVGIDKLSDLDRRALLHSKAYLKALRRRKTAKP